MAKLVQARVLCAFAGVACDSVVAGTKEEIEKLIRGGTVDADPAAVKCALAEGAQVVKLSAAEDTAEE